MAKSIAPATPAWAGIGAVARAEAVLESFDGRFYVLRVAVRNGEQELGRGTVTRAVVSLANIREKAGNG